MSLALALDLADQQRARVGGEVSYREFLAHFGVTCTEGQGEIVRVAYDGEEPRGSAMWGGAQTIPPLCRRVFVARCGGRGGKSYVLGALRLVWGALVRDLTRLAPGQQAVSLIVAPDMRLAREVLRYIRGVIKSDPALDALVIGDTTETLTIRRDDGYVVSFECLPATRGGSALRGRWLTDALLDECAFFRDDNYQVNDLELFRAVAPRVLPGGQVLLLSTPWAEDGLHFDEHAKNFGHPETAMAATATTEQLNPDPDLAQVIAAERARDPDNAAREYDAIPMRSGGEKFFDAALVASCIDPTLSPDLPRTPLPGEVVTAGGDLAFRRDSAALAIGHHGHDDVIRLGQLVEMRPEEGAPLKPSAVVGGFAKIIQAHHGTCLMADAHYRETVVEHLEDFALGYVPAPTQPADAFVATRQAMREGRAKIPKHPRLIAQLREAVLRPTPGGGMTVVLPRRRGAGHGDLVSAYVLAVYQACGDTVPTPEPAHGTKAWEEKQRDDRIAKRKAKETAPWWRGGKVKR